MESEKKSYSKILSDRKLFLRTNGWTERTNSHRCGNHWVNLKKYGNEKFSFKEAERVEFLSEVIVSPIQRKR